jgi:DNA-binding IclR family transcriptional regulator
MRKQHDEHRTGAARASVSDRAHRKPVRDRQFVTALARGLEILSCFSAEQPERTGSDIARLTGLPQPTVWRLCHTMIEMGVLVATPGDRMRPGLAALRLGSSALAGLDTVDLARPAMQALADDYRAACGLAVRQGLQMVMIERCHGNNPLLTNLRRGSVVPMASSGHGWAYLAALPAAARQSLIAEVRAADPPGWAAVRVAFRTALDAFQADGYIVNSGRFHPDYHTAAVPVHDRDGNIRFTLNCGAPLSTLTPDQLRDDVAPRLKRLAEELQAAIAMESGRRAS